MSAADLIAEPERKTSRSKPDSAEGKRSRRGLVMVAGGLGVVAVVGVLGYLQIIPVPRISFDAGTPTPVAVASPVKTPATPAPTETAVAAVTTTSVVSSVPSETPAPATPEPTPTPTAVVVATPKPTPTAVAVVATPKPTPTPKAAEDPEVKKKKAAGQVKAGNDALNAGDGPKAVKLFTSAVINDPTNAEAHLGLGTAHMLNGDNPKAKKSFQKFLQLAPNHQYAAQTRQIIGSL